jgi:hypothetical protein
MKRSIASAIVAVALLAGVACSGGGGGLTPQAGPAITLTTPKSVSPALAKVRPMATTAVLPASAMTGRQPATAIEPQQWSIVPGTASAVTASSDGSIWVLSDQPAGPDKFIWHYSGGTWTNITGLASHIAIAPNGTLYAINSSGGIYAYSGGSWTSPGGGASAITVLADNSIVVVSNAGTGDQGIWRYNGSWKQMAGAGISVSGSTDTLAYTVGSGSVEPGGLYIVNVAGAIYYENLDDSFAQLPAAAMEVATRPGGVFALGASAIDPGDYGIFYFDMSTKMWTQQTGAAASLSVGADNELYVVTGAGAIYATGTGTPTPQPTQTPTTAPSSTPTNAPTATPTIAPTATPTVAPTATPTAAPNATPIPAYVFSGPGDSFQFSGGGSGDLKPFGAWHNVGYTQLAWSQNQNNSGFDLGVFIAVNSGDVFLNGQPATFPVDDAVPGATPVIYYQFTNTASFDLVFTSTPSILVNYLVPFPGATCYVDQYAPNGGGYAWTTTGLTGQPEAGSGSYYLFFTAVYLNNGANLPLPSGVSYDAVSCK